MRYSRRKRILSASSVPSLPSTSKKLLLICSILSSAGSLYASPIINEIHYNNDLNYVATEFIELYNPGPTPVDLAGWKLTGGIDFTFPENYRLEAVSYTHLRAHET